MRYTHVLIAVAAIALFLFAGDAFGQQLDIGKVADNTGNVSKNIANAAFNVLSLIGFLCAGVGIYKIVMAKKTNEPMGLGIGMTLGGALMLALPIIINATTQTAVNTNASGLDRLQLNGN